MSSSNIDNSFALQPLTTLPAVTTTIGSSSSRDSVLSPWIVAATTAAVWNHQRRQRKILLSNADDNIQRNHLQHSFLSPSVSNLPTSSRSHDKEERYQSLWGICDSWREYPQENDVRDTHVQQHESLSVSSSSSSEMKHTNDWWTLYNDLCQSLLIEDEKLLVPHETPIMATKNFRDFLENVPFTVFTSLLTTNSNNNGKHDVSHDPNTRIHKREDVEKSSLQRSKGQPPKGQQQEEGSRLGHPGTAVASSTAVVSSIVLPRTIETSNEKNQWNVRVELSNSLLILFNLARSMVAAR